MPCAECRTGCWHDIFPLRRGFWLQNAVLCSVAAYKKKCRALPLAFISFATGPQFASVFHLFDSSFIMVSWAHRSKMSSHILISCFIFFACTIGTRSSLSVFSNLSPAENKFQHWVSSFYRRIQFLGRRCDSRRDIVLYRTFPFLSIFRMKWQRNWMHAVAFMQKG